MTNRTEEIETLLHNYKKSVKISLELVVPCVFGLTVFNFYYLFRYALKVQHNRLHLLMFFLT